MPDFTHERIQRIYAALHVYAYPDSAIQERLFWEASWLATHLPGIGRVNAVVEDVLELHCTTAHEDYDAALVGDVELNALLPPSERGWAPQTQVLRADELNAAFDRLQGATGGASSCVSATSVPRTLSSSAAVDRAIAVLEMDLQALWPGRFDFSTCAPETDE